MMNVFLSTLLNAYVFFCEFGLSKFTLFTRKSVLVIRCYHNLQIFFGDVSSCKVKDLSGAREGKNKPDSNRCQFQPQKE